MPHKKLNLNQKVSYLSQFHEKSLKELFLKQQKNNIIDLILTDLIQKHKIKISQRSVFLLTNFVNYYQMLHKIMDYNVNHVTKYIDNLKDQKYRKGANLPKSVKNQQIIQKTTFRKIVSQSYKSKCFQQYFELKNYSQDKIVATVVQKVIQKIKKGELKLMQNHPNTSRKVSICMPNKHLNFKEIYNQESLKQKGYKISELTNIQEKENEKQQKKCNLLKNISNKQKMSTQRNNTKLFPQIKKIQISQIAKDSQNKKSNLRVKAFKTYKSVHSVDSRRNGFHEVNKIAIEIGLLKDSFKVTDMSDQELMELSGSIKYRLTFLLDNLKVRSLVQKAKQIRKIR